MVPSRKHQPEAPVLILRILVLALKGHVSSNQRVSHYRSAT